MFSTLFMILHDQQTLPELGCFMGEHCESKLFDALSFRRAA